MKILIPTLFLFFYSFNVFSIDGVKNQIDSLGLKQGFWIEFEAHPVSTGFTINDYDSKESDIEKKFDYNKFNRFKFCGNYKDGYRTDIWFIYSQSNKLLFKINYKAGIISGLYENYLEDGKILKCQIEKKLKSKVEVYSKEGSLQEVSYISTEELIRSIVEY